MNDSPRVILLHGLWMRPVSMAILDSRLRQAGFSTSRIGYASVQGGPKRAMPALVGQARHGPCHVVAHSLGGLVALATLDAHPDLPVQRVVCLGSPLCGSAAAHGMTRLPLLRSTLGRSRRLLLRGCRPWQGRAQVGMIAGTRPLGLGRFVGPVHGENDGTVAVEETCLEGLADRISIPASHTSLLYSPEAARQAIAFLRDGRFDHAA